MSVVGTILDGKKGPETFPPESLGRLELSEVIDLYKSVGRRNIDYFAWIHDVYSWITLPCVAFDWKRALSEDKTKLTVFDILADDLADNRTTRSYSLLQDLADIPWQESARTAETSEYLAVGRRIWEDSLSSVSCYPRFKEFERVFYFDLRQVLSSMMYSSLANTDGIENPIETSFYSSYGCLVEVAIDMDLMCSPAFDMKELGLVRTVACLAQKVAHVGNMMTTYPSEVLEGDVSSPIISLALRKGLIRHNELGDASTVPKLSKLEWVFKSRAHSYIRKVADCEKEIRSVNLRGFSDFLTELIGKFEGSRSLR
ncbi:MAG: hypothetical protein AUI50_01100 [Crenarchaeota archaeon 13_1_40CM_2_52_14]|nr:MAG: hypothetical protein AUI97_01220 [Crenarchaeota archaeon 13_1_40CM_3_52_17]OLD35729.1 MAG: hypothetical protein AUI50_01100 [Crenarchaeota archaeon 13_1_40CM_2_52_14]OLE68192.1 MAG: hypothetical protein AUF78_17330 [archaeon 13_1_20CM_2_51_12]